MARVTGLGGVFHKVADPAATKAWYAETLGLTRGDGPLLPWSLDETGRAYSLVWPFDAGSDYFAPSSAAFMINLRVDDLDGFLDGLRAKGIPILASEDHEYGRFAWIMDCDGIKIELWQQTGPVPGE